MGMTTCPHCQDTIENTTGMLSGTCSNCGFNHLDGTFRWIKVAPESLDRASRVHLVNEHADNTYRPPDEPKLDLQRVLQVIDRRFNRHRGRR